MDFYPKKSLGQNFLIHPSIAKKIAKLSGVSSDDCVLEIGPGKGILTAELSKLAKKVIAVEIDRELSKKLKDKFSGNTNVKIINNDILKIDIGSLFSSIDNSKKYKVVANLPYYITSPIIRMFLENDTPPSEMILMVQKEVAERIVAQPGKMSILAASVQYYARPEILFLVGKENFDPAPQVDSAVIRISAIACPEAVEKFFRVVRAGFCSKRKTLVNNLSSSFHLEKKQVENILSSIGLKPAVRAQELSIAQWKELSNLLLDK